MRGHGARQLPNGFPEKPLIGMIHMPALPGAPGNTLAMDALVRYALSEARILERAGLDAVIVENVGDTPFFKERVPPVTIAAMTAIAGEVVAHTKLAVGLNVLRNACAEALSIAHVTAARFIRCNIMIGAYATDQGVIEGCAAALARLKHELGAHVLIFGDVHVKHAHPLFDVPIEHAAADLAERGGADAVIVSGARSPIPPAAETLDTVRAAVALPVLVGSGVGLANVQQLYRASDGLILGEPDFKIDAVWGGPSDERAYATAVQRCRG
ncbi:MAG TPA: BtpA/SgcQ family protein [bacterium]|nr:BtpA/SgcQ family protein [bacterium]